MEDDQKFRALLETTPPLSIEGTGFRSVIPMRASAEEIVSGEGSRRFGGRWNPVGVAAIYLSDSLETALSETLAHQRYYGLPVTEALPRTFVAISYRLSGVLDLTDGAVRRRLKFSAVRMCSTDWRKEMDAGRESGTQRLGRLALEAGRSALVVPSAARRGGRNLVIFRQNLSRRDFVRVEL